MESDVTIGILLQQITIGKKMDKKNMHKTNKNNNNNIINETVSTNAPHIEKMIPVNKLYLKNLYSNKDGLRGRLESLRKVPQMEKIISEPLRFLDHLIYKHIIHSPIEVFERYDPNRPKEDFVENVIRIGHDEYTVSEECYQNIFYDLLSSEGSSGSHIYNRKASFDILKERLHQILADLYPKDNTKEKALVKHKSSRNALLTASIQIDNDIKKKIIDPEKRLDFIIDDNSLDFIKKSIKLIHDKNLYESHISVSKDSVTHKDETNKIVIRKLMSTINECYASSCKKYNANFNETKGDLLRLPFTKLATSLGSSFVKKILFLDVDSLIDEIKNPLILEWIKDPNLIKVGKLQKTLDKTTKIEFVEGFDYSAKHIKFIITFLCFEYYKKFFDSKENWIEKKPDIFNLLRLHMGSSISEIQRYLERTIAKLGTVLISLMNEKGIFQGSGLLDTFTLLPMAKAKGSANTVRVVYISPKVAATFLSSDNLERPYLIKTNCKRPITTRYFGVTDQIEYLYQNYRTSLDNKIHSNDHTACIIHDIHISTHKTKFSIDLEALMSLCSMICEGLSLLVQVLKKPVKNRMAYSHISILAFLSLLDITGQQIVFLHKVLPELLNEFLSYLIDFNLEHSVMEQFKNKVEDNVKTLIAGKAFSSEKEIAKITGAKELLIRLLNKSTGIKHSLKNLIREAIIYSHFGHFTITSFLDTRGRRYYRNTYLNIQGYSTTKVIVKMYCKPLQGVADSYRENLVRECFTISNVLSDFMNTPSMREKIKSNHVRNTWLHEHNCFNGLNPRESLVVTSRHLITRKFSNRWNQFIGYCSINESDYKKERFLTDYLADVANGKTTLDDLYKNKRKLKEIIKIIYNFCKNKKKFIIALNIFRTIIIDTEILYKDYDIYKYMPMFPYPYELDATASGIQMTALFLKDPSLARWSNLISNKNDLDLYTHAASTFKKNIDEILAYNIPAQIAGDKSLDDYIPMEYHWFIQRLEDTLVKKRTVKDYIKLFKETQSLIRKIFDYNPSLYKACTKRDLFKKSIMTYGYNSTTSGRVLANIEMFNNDENVQADQMSIKIIANLVEDHFKIITQPSLIPNAAKIKLISKILAESLLKAETTEATKDTKLSKETQNKEDSQNDMVHAVDEKDPDNDLKKNLGTLTESAAPTADKITITNEFLTHIIRPTKSDIEKINTNSLKKAERGYQANVALTIYDSTGKPVLDHAKAELLFGPNLMHTMDAAIVHTLTGLVYDLNQLLRKEKDLKGRQAVRDILFTSTHDSFGFSNSLFAKGLIELAYLIVHKQNYRKGIEDNPSFATIKKSSILYRNYQFPKKKKPHKNLLKLNTLQPKKERILILKKIKPNFVK